MKRHSHTHVPEAHEPTLLCSGPAGTVTCCSCGNVHVNLQYLTLRFEPEAFRELAGLLALAQHRLDHEVGLPPSAPASDTAPVH